jgi:Domain of unknown function (DU1801)
MSFTTNPEPVAEADIYYLFLDEPVKSCLLSLRDLILSMDKAISAVWRYGMPFFYYRKKMFCYLWVHKKYKQPYLGMVEGKRLHHPKLISENRSRMKIMLFDPNKDLPVRTIKKILQEAIVLYENNIKVK